MSRVALNPRDPEKHPAVICGLDHAMGWFFQVFGPDDEDGEEVLLVNKDSIFTPRFGQGDMIDLIRQYAADDPLSTHCITRIVEDFDPALGIEAMRPFMKND